MSLGGMRFGGGGFPAIRNYVAEGDSLTDTSTNTGGSYTDRTEAVASPAMATYTNAAVSGSSIADMESRAATVDGYIVDGAANILSVMIGYNDLATLGVATYLANLASYLDDRRAAGWHVVLCTLLPTNIANYNTYRASVNPELRLWVTNGSVVAGKHADTICDFAADSAMGNDGDQNDTTYRTGDAIHLTYAGTNRLFHIFWPVLDNVMRNDTSDPVITYQSYECETGGPDFRVYLEADRGVVWSVSGNADFSIDELWQLDLNSAVSAGEHTVTLTATDGGGRATSVTFTWTVADPPSGYGPNLVLNGKFLNGFYGWTRNSGAVAAGVDMGESDGIGYIDALSTGYGYPQFTQGITTVTSTNYRANADMAKNTANGNATLKVDGSNRQVGAATLTAMAAYDFAASGTSVNLIPFIFNAAATGRALFDNIAVREIL